MRHGIFILGLVPVVLAFSETDASTAELSHHGHKVTAALATRRATRRGRRQRKTRYRKPRFDNRRKKGEGWPPVLATWVIRSEIERQRKLSPFLLFEIYSSDG